MPTTEYTRQARTARQHSRAHTCRFSFLALALLLENREAWWRYASFSFFATRKHKPFSKKGNGENRKEL
jgi:hypothetical protein